MSERVGEKGNVLAHLSNFKNNPEKIKDCFEGVNRATFAFNQALDGIIFKPIAKAYKVLPSPVKSGVSNSLDNLSNLVTIPNNILQGDIKTAIINTGRLALNTTVGLLGTIDVANKMGFPKYEKEDYGQSLAKGGVGPGRYPVKASREIIKLIESAMDNARHQYEDIDAEEMEITHIAAHRGQIRKGWIPRARGRATPSNHYQVNLEIFLEDFNTVDDELEDEF